MKVFAILTTISVLCAITCTITIISISQKFPSGGDIISVDPSNNVIMLLWISLIGFVVSTTLLISYAIFKGVDSIRKQKKQKQTLS